MLNDAAKNLRRLFCAWGTVFLLGFLLVRIEIFNVFLHWIPLAILGFWATRKALPCFGKSPLMLLGYWVVIATLTITATGLVFSGAISYPAFIPLWGIGILGWLGLTHLAFGFWIRNKQFALIGATWMIISSALWNAPLNPDNTELIALAMATSIPYFVAGLSIKKDSNVQPDLKPG